MGANGRWYLRHACVEEVGLRANQENLRFTEDHSPLISIPRSNKFLIVVLLLALVISNEAEPLLVQDSASLVACNQICLVSGQSLFV